MTLIEPHCEKWAAERPAIVASEGDSNLALTRLAERAPLAMGHEGEKPFTR